MGDSLSYLDDLLPATTSLENAVDTADFEVLDVTAGDPRSVNSPSAAHVLDVSTSVSEGSSEVESISRPETPYSTCSEATDQKDQGDATDSKQVSPNRRKLIEQIKEKRDSKLSKSQCQIAQFPYTHRSLVDKRTRKTLS